MSGYPPAREDDVVDDFHGTKVADPYRWLEDLDSAETRQWVNAQNALTAEYLLEIPERAKIHKRLTDLWSYERTESVFEVAGRVFSFKNTGLQNQSVLYVRDTPESQDRVLIDPNTLSPDGTDALGTITLSWSGDLMVWGTRQSGGDWEVFRVRNVATGQDLGDELNNIKFSNAAWAPGDTGFYYSRYETGPESQDLSTENRSPTICFHKLGTSQDQDEIVYQRPDKPEWLPSPIVSEDGKWLFIHVSLGTAPENALLVQDLSSPGSPIREVFDELDARYSRIDSIGSKLWVQTNLDAPNGRIVTVDLASDDPRSTMTEIVPESKDALIGTSFTGGKMFLQYLQDGAYRVEVINPDGGDAGQVELPSLGTVVGFGGRSDSARTYYWFSGYTTPPGIYVYEIATGRSEIFAAAAVPFDPSPYSTKKVFYTSRDGTSVPMFICHRKDIPLNGDNPTYLHGYGGFGVPQTPAYMTWISNWLEMGGIHATACLRGGGEYGEKWRLAGAKLNRQNVFDDFIAAAEYLISEGYTRQSKLAIAGGSNGGLLVGACMTQRPDLFGACLPAVGVLDMLRFHKFTIGWAWVSDYGSPDDPEEFNAIYKYSPLHNVREGAAYPPTMITTADHDDRVVPSHSFKFTATLQKAQASRNPILARIDVQAGHGLGKATSKVIDEAADRAAFLVRELDIGLPASYGS